MRTALTLLALSVLGLLASTARAEERELRLATVACVQDSGLLDALLPDLTKETGIRVRVIAVPSDAVLRLAAEGSVDVVLGDSSAREDALLASRALVARHPLMEDYTLIVGPKDDPAEVGTAASGSDAFRRMAAARAPYVARDDDSAERSRETALLSAAGLDVATGWPGFARTKAGLAQVLLQAGARKAYALSDLGTFLLFEKRTGLARLSKADGDLRNVYALATVNPEKHPGRIQSENASRLVEWFLRATTSRRIAEFGREKLGESLYRPLDLDVD